MRMLTVFACLVLVGSLSAYAQASPGQMATAPRATQRQAAPEEASLRAASPKIGPAKEADTQRLLKVMKAKALAAQSAAAIQKKLGFLLANAFPPGTYRERLISLLLKKMMLEAQKHALDVMASTYDQNFSDEEIKKLIKFYETPLGQKTLAVVQKIQPKLWANGWARRTAQRSLEEVLVEHPKLFRELKAAEKSSHHQ